MKELIFKAIGAFGALILGTFGAYFIMVAAAFMIFGCGKSQDDVAFVPELPSCVMPVADAGTDKMIIKGIGLPEYAVIGTPAAPENTYAWSPVLGLGSPAQAVTTARPLQTQKYLLTVSNSCGQATATVTVHVYSEGKEIK